MASSPYPSTLGSRSASTSAFSPTARGAADFLRAHDKMAAILPGLTRMLALQKACTAALPAMFEACAVLKLEAGHLTLSTPNAALAAKLRQRLPNLQETLQAQGWHITAIRLKIQMTQPDRAVKLGPPPVLPVIATSAFAALGAALEDSPRNQALRAAIDTMVRRS